MLIEMDKNYEDKIISHSKLSDVEIAGLSIILNSVVEGRNLFKASFEFFEFLKNKCGKLFSSQVRNYLEGMYNKYFTIMSDLNGVCPALMITDDFNITNMSTNCSCRVPLRNIPKLLFGSLYCENISDCLFFETIYKKFNYPTRNVFIDKQTFGGGSGKGTIESLLKSDERVFFCIADSDRNYDGSRLGSTANSIKDIYLKSNHHFSTYYILKVREKENLLPFELVKNYKDFDDEQKMLLNLIDKSNSNVKNFFDIKDGVSKKYRLEMKNDKKLFDIYNQIMGKMKRKHMYHAEKGSHYLIRGIGNNAVDKILPLLNNEKLFMEKLTFEQKSDWNEIFSQITRFCLAYQTTYN